MLLGVSLDSEHAQVEADVEEPVPLQASRKAHTAHARELKDQALALLLAGRNAAQVARQLGLSHSTVLYWWREHGPSEPRALAQREQMGQQVYDTVHATLEALAARARLTADEDWIREQSAAALAHLDAVHWDRVIRLLGALRPAEPPDGQEPEDLET